jgi:hypothetical protein
MPILAWLVAAVAATPFLIGQSTAPVLKVAHVRATVCDTFGVPVSEAVVTLTSAVGSDKVATTGGIADFENVPLGTYDLDVRLVGFLTRHERVEIQLPEVAFRIGLRLGHTEPSATPELTGVVKGGSNGRGDLWVRLMALYSSDFVENNVNGDGGFDLSGMASGKYLLVLLQKDKVLAVKPVDVLDRKQSIEVTVDSPNGMNPAR